MGVIRVPFIDSFVGVVFHFYFNPLSDVGSKSFLWEKIYPLILLPVSLAVQKPLISWNSLPILDVIFCANNLLQRYLACTWILKCSTCVSLLFQSFGSMLVSLIQFESNCPLHKRARCEDHSISQTAALVKAALIPSVCFWKAVFSKTRCPQLCGCFPGPPSYPLLAGCMSFVKSQSFC